MVSNGLEFSGYTGGEEIVSIIASYCFKKQRWEGEGSEGGRGRGRGRVEGRGEEG